MLSSAFVAIRVAFAATVVGLNTVLHCLPLFVVAFFKLIPIEPWRRLLSVVLIALAESWIRVNSAVFAAMSNSDWQVEGLGQLHRDRSYLVLCNHQSWVDIPVLQRALIGHIPFLRFFLKKQLIWVPFLGLAWWALDFPFMTRYSRSELEKNPSLRGKDRETTRRACEKFRKQAVSVMNFVEGTRFTTAKHRAQSSPYVHLLKPKAGGVAFVLDAMGDVLHGVVDVTIMYPAGRPTLVDLLAGRVEQIKLHVQERPIPAELLRGDYENDAEFRARFQAWIQQLWQEKDAKLECMAGA
ncbi:acyltransferase [Pseudomarimonas arenosa]|uniref:acyltransferase n=1 Tax=Pseudomarimonas arenosa TaxID=2774145 RepID=UPI002FC29B56